MQVEVDDNICDGLSIYFPAALQNDELDSIITTYPLAGIILLSMGLIIAIFIAWA